MLPTECYSSLVGYNTNGATLTNLSVYGPECLSGFQMLAYMLSLSGLICCGGGSDGESGLDLLRDEGGKSDESSGYRSNYYATSSNDNITLPGVTTMLPVVYYNGPRTCYLKKGGIKKTTSKTWFKGNGFGTRCKSSPPP
ncbi:hypothetical protein Tco_0975705 [Tanacetum coccineum]|uniref:Uncharacterized protein n=1 Tax=Tanacetum coccineum TaxID=301880 RepID=A0ABQ5EF48_9ASTR